MAKKRTVNFGQVQDDDGNVDRRMNMDTKEVPDATENEEEGAPEKTPADGSDDVESDGLDVSTSAAAESDSLPTGSEDDQEQAEQQEAPKLTPQEKALVQIQKLGAFFSDHKEDDIHKSYKVNKIHIQLISEMAEKIHQRRALHLSDGNISMIDMVFKALSKRVEL